MRIWLQEKKQKELLKKEKEILDLNWQEFSKYLNISFGRLNSWIYEENLLPEEIFNKLLLKKDYEKFIIEKLPEGWGKIKGGKLSSGNTKDIKIPKRSEELAELWGILLGDGHIAKFKGYRLGVYNINITGHSILDKDYLLNFVKPLAERLFGVSGRIYFSKTSKALHVILDGRNIVDFFEKEELKSGDKIKNQSTIPDWIKENPRFLAACLRGLHDTDGCFYRLTNQNSYQISFTNHDKTLLEDARKALISLNIGVSKIINGRKYVITKKEEIAKFYKLIGFHNSKHLNKINGFMQNLAL
jgi:intein/homing endonuclease